MTMKAKVCGGGLLVAAWAGLLGSTAVHAAPPAAQPAAAPPPVVAAASARDVREAALKIQQRLRAEQRAREQAQRNEAKNERCIGGQRMRRVANGWVDAGNC
jgi:hypothetical protein